MFRTNNNSLMCRRARVCVLGSFVQVPLDTRRCVPSRHGSNHLPVERQWSQPVREK